MRKTYVTILLVATAALAGCTRMQTIGLDGRERECVRIMQHLTEEAGTEGDLVDADSAPRTYEGDPVDAVTVTYADGPARRLVTCFYARDTREMVGIRFQGEALPPGRVTEVLRAVR